MEILSIYEKTTYIIEDEQKDKQYKVEIENDSAGFQTDISYYDNKTNEKIDDEDIIEQLDKTIDKDEDFPLARY